MPSVSRVVRFAGPLLVLAYCVINSSKSVLEAALVQNISPEFLAFHTFLVAQGFYLVVCRDKRGMIKGVRRSWRDVVAFNVSTAISWLAVLYAFTVLEPAVANSIIIGLIPSITIVLGRWMRPESAVVRLEVVAAVGVLSSMFYLAGIAVLGSSAIGDVPVPELLLGLLACLLTATAVAGNTFYTKRLGEAGMTVGQMMACRFLLLLAVTLTILTVRDSASPYTTGTVLAMLLISVVGVIISLYLLQMGIVRTEPITVSMLFGVNLVITFIVQFFDPRLDHSVETFAGVALVSAFMCLGAWARYRIPAVPTQAAGSPSDDRSVAVPVRAQEAER